jgi:hypothetical protein
MAAGFSRSLPQELVGALKQLAAENDPNWWKEILDNPKLQIAIRKDYLNVYAKGQSVLKIELSKTNRRQEMALVMTTHYKYLLKDVPSAKRYVKFDGKQFLANGGPVDPTALIQTDYIPKRTISELIGAAVSYSDPEKSAVHTIAEGNPNVVDMEIAFSRERELEDLEPSNQPDNGKAKASTTAQRIDLAALHRFGTDKVRLVFYEVKRFDDARLWGSHPKVLKQIKSYDAFPEENEKELKVAYKNVCVGLSQLRLACPGLVHEVAHGKDLEIDKRCRLVVTCYDSDQGSGSRLRQLIKQPELQSRTITRGRPKGLILSVRASRYSRAGQAF